MPKILVADDNTNIQKMVTLAFQERGYEVVSVGNGEAAVRRLPDLKPDMVLADIFMPVRNGYELCEYIKKDHRFAQIPVILLLGAFDPLDEKEAHRVGADGILKKPFVPPDPLIAMVTAVLEKNPAIAAELQKKKKPSTTEAAPKATITEPMKPLSRLSQLRSEMADLVPQAATPAAPVEKKPVEPPAPATPVQAATVVAGPTQPDEDFDAVTAPDWRQSARSFEIPAGDEIQSALLDRQLAGEGFQGATALDARKLDSSDNDVPLASAPGVVETQPRESLELRTGPASKPPHTRAQESETAEFTLERADLEETRPVEAPAAAAQIETAAMIDSTAEMIDAAMVSDTQIEELPSAPVASEWHAPLHSENAEIKAIPVETESNQVAFYEPPPRDVPVAEVALNEETATPVVADIRREDPRIPAPAHMRKLGNDDVIEAPMAQSLDTPAVPEPTFSSRMRGWMESIAPSGTPEGGWLASVADVLTGKRIEQAKPSSSSAQASSVVTEAQAAEAPALVETPPLAVGSEFVPLPDEPFFLDEALNEAVAKIETAQDIAHVDVNEGGTDANVAAPDFVVEQPSEAAESETANVSAGAIEFSETAPAIEDFSGVQAEQAEQTATPTNLPESVINAAATPNHVAEYKDPNLVEPVGIAITAEPLLVNEDEAAKQGSAYGKHREEVPPLYTFEVPASSAASTPAISGSADAPAASSVAQTGAAEAITAAREIGASAEVDRAQTAGVSAALETNSPETARDMIESDEWSANAPAVAQLPWEAPLPAERISGKADELFASFVSESVSSGSISCEPASTEAVSGASESESATAEEDRPWLPTIAPPNAAALAEIPFLTPSREFLAGTAEKNWSAHIIAQDEHAAPASHGPQEQHEALVHTEQAAAAEERGTPEAAAASSQRTESSLSPAGSAEGLTENVPGNQPPTAKSQPTAAVSPSAKDVAVDEVVRKVLDRLEPRLHELLAQGLLKPLVESILHEDSERK